MVKRYFSAPVTKSHSRAVLSRLPVRTRRWSVDTDKAVTSSVCPDRRLISFAVARSQSRGVGSFPQVIAHRPSLLSAPARTWSECPNCTISLGCSLTCGSFSFSWSAWLNGQMIRNNRERAMKDGKVLLITDFGDPPALGFPWGDEVPAIELKLFVTERFECADFSLDDNRSVGPPTVSTA